MTIVQPEITSQTLVLHTSEKKEMLSVRTEDGKTYVKINSSSLALIQECLRKTSYSLREGWRAEGESPATLFGSAVHSFMEVFYTAKPDERRLFPLETLEMMSYGHTVAEEQTEPTLRAVRAFLTRGAQLSSLPESDKRSLQNGVWLLSEYIKKFHSDPYSAYVDSHGPFIERRFDLPFFDSPRLNITIFGTIDFVLQHTVTGDLLPGDHKTTSSMGFGESSFFDREKPNHQYSMYMMALHRLYGIKTEDFLVNVFEVKQKPKTTRGSGPSFPRQITKRSEEDFTELQDVIIESVERYLSAIEKNRFPLGPVEACQKYGGCQFKQVCASPRSMRETILRNKFTGGLNAEN